MKTVLAMTAAALLTIGAAFADPVTLRARIETTGPAVTLGDVFENAGPAAARAFALSPAPGRTQQFSTRFIAATAAASGLEWTPPAGMDTVPVTRVAASASNAARVQRAGAGATNTAVRRGEMFTLVYVAPGLQLTTRARALADGAVGDTIRAVNLQSNRPVEVTVTGTGAATASAN